MNIRKLGTRKNLNFFFGWREALVGVAGCEGHARGGLCEVGAGCGGSREVGLHAR